MAEQVFDEKTRNLLDAQLDPRFVSTRKGGGNTNLKYIEGHDAIDQANRLFGYGNWAYRPLSCEQCVLRDALTGEAVGISYKAQVELIVRGCVAPIVEVGSQPVASWNVEDQIMKRRISDARYNKKPVDESDFTPLERTNARAVIVDAHEMAEKGAVTDALKRALRTFGEQFGNGLYGDGKVPMDVVAPKSQEIFAKGKQKGIWLDSQGFFDFASKELNVTVDKNTILSLEQRIQLDNAIYAVEPISKAS